MNSTHYSSQWSEIFLKAPSYFFTPVLLKFMFSKKATKIDKIFTAYLTYVEYVEIDGVDFVNFCGLLWKHELYNVSMHLKIKACVIWDLSVFMTFHPMALQYFASLTNM